MMPLPPTPDSFWECVFPRAVKLWPRAGPGSLQDAPQPSWFSGREVPCEAAVPYLALSMRVQASDAAAW